MYKFPKPLSWGATIGVIAPASAAHRKQTRAGLDYLEQRGFAVKTAPNLTRGKFYLAGDDAHRLKWLEEFILDPGIEAIICVRGGYGVLRIIDKINYWRLAAIPPKMIVGYSDITALQMAFMRKLGWVGYTGPMVAPDMSGEFDTYSEQWLWKVLMGHPYPLTLENPPGEKIGVYREGSAKGTLVGGCLSLITPLLGTEYMPDLRGAVLVIEDIGEKTYHLDKHLHMLRIHGVFEQISGLILGHFVNCFPRNPRRSFTMEELLNEILRDYDFPVVTNFAYGHIKKRLTLPLGARVRLNTSPIEIEITGS
ncbi:MAG TPA: LD-carboxypeptidase [Candidatus Marinimicrobia bacterium]|nr:LD-carboxypeptidase [Candidatus Neomarinimicrobiota bacterium]